MAFVTRFCANLVSKPRRSLLTGTTRTNTFDCNRAFHVLCSRTSQLPSAALSSNENSSNCAALPTPFLTTNALQRLLTPFSALVTQVCGFKVKARLKRRCKDCYFVIRQQRHYVICPTHRRHKQMSMKKRDYKTWILTDATQSKVRPF